MIEAELVLGGLEGVLNGPALPFDCDKGLDRGAGRAPGAEIGQFAVRTVTTDQQPTCPKPLGSVHVFVGFEMGERDVSPVVQPRAFRALARRQTLPGVVGKAAGQALGCVEHDRQHAPRPDLVCARDPKHVSLAGPAQSDLDFAHAVDRVRRDPGKRHAGGDGALDHGKRDPRLGRELDRVRDVGSRAPRRVAAKVVERGGGDVLALKGNQGSLHDDVRCFLDDPDRPVERSHTTVDADHGRVETRTSLVSTDIGWLQDLHAWPDLAAIGRVVRSREAAGKVSTETAYYLLSTPLSAARFGEVARAHWGVEDGLHWVLDVTMNEERARNRKDHGPQNIALLR